MSAKGQVWKNRRCWVSSSENVTSTPQHSTSGAITHPMFPSIRRTVLYMWEKRKRNRMVLKNIVIHDPWSSRNIFNRSNWPETEILGVNVHWQLKFMYSLALFQPQEYLWESPLSNAFLFLYEERMANKIHDN